MFLKVVTITNAHQAWEIFEKIYQGANKVKNVKLHMLKKKFENLKMRDTKK